MKPNQRLDKELILRQISHLAWVEKSEYIPTQNETCVEIKRKDFLNHKLHSLWELDS
jgi:hypothetical protein